MATAAQNEAKSPTKLSTRPRTVEANFPSGASKCTSSTEWASLRRHRQYHFEKRSQSG